jgi:hypothetical protein
MKKALITLVACYLSMIAIIEVAHASDTNQCDMALHSAIRITADRIDVISADGVLMQISSEDQLLIANKPVRLIEQQRQLLKAYSLQVRETVPAIVDIALVGVELGLTAVTEVFYELLDAEPPASLTTALGRIKTRVDQQLSRENGNIYLDARGVSDFDSVMEKLEPEIEALMTASLGEVFTNIGNSLKADDSSLAESITRLTERMEGFPEELEMRLERQVETLSTKADGLCQQLQNLQLAELKLQDAIPAAKPFDLVEPHANLL